MNTALADRDVRRSLTSLIRRRIPQQDVEDVAQTVLCDALAGAARDQRLPTNPEELRRYLVGIARHKIADFHRKAARGIQSDEDPSDLPVAGTHLSAEERHELECILAAPRTRRDAETLEWLVREHRGERLADIARELGIPATVVRKRISRLRILLRAAVIGVVLIAGFGAWRIYDRDAEPPAIAPELVVPKEPEPPPKPITPDADFSGDWVIDGLTPERVLSPTEKRIVASHQKNAIVRIDDAMIRLDSAGGPLVWPRNGAEVRLTKDARGDRVDIRVSGQGLVTLRRPVF